MKLRLAILIVLTAGILFPNPQPAETAANVDVQQLRYKFKYTCNGETIVVFHCRHDDDTPQFAPTKPENDYCQVSYPDRPLRNGFRVETVELQSDVVKKLQSCGAFNPPSNTPSNVPSNATPTANADVDKAIVAYLNQGDQYRAAKKYPEALATYQKANSLRPSVGAFSRIGLVYLDLKQYPNALAAFQSAVRLNPNDATSYFNLGTTYSRMEQYENAVNALKEALRLKPDLGNAINSLGLVYFKLDRYSEALAAHQEAVRLEPNDATAINNLALTYLDLGRKEEALAVYKDLQRVDPAKAKELYEDINASFGKTDDAQTNLFLAMSFYDLGAKGYLYSLRILRRIVLLKAEPDALGDAHYLMGKIYTDQKKPTIATAEFEKAALTYQQAIRLHPREADGYFSLGRVYIAQHKKDSALRVYKTLQGLDPAQAKTLYEEINKQQ